MGSVSGLGRFCGLNRMRRAEALILTGEHVHEYEQRREAAIPASRPRFGMAVRDRRRQNVADRDYSTGANTALAHHSVVSP